MVDNAQQSAEKFSHLEQGLTSDDLRAARRAAVQYAYAMDFAQSPLFFERDFEAFVAQVELLPRVKNFVHVLVQLVHEHRDSIDRHIESCAHNWRISRMAKVDLAILRVCTCELQFRSGVATEIVLADAAEIGKEIGASGTSAFVNGVLDSIAKRVRVVGEEA